MYIHMHMYVYIYIYTRIYMYIHIPGNLVFPVDGHQMGMGTNIFSIYFLFFILFYFISTYTRESGVSSGRTPDGHGHQHFLNLFFIFIFILFLFLFLHIPGNLVFPVDGHQMGMGTNIFSIYADPEEPATWETYNLQNADLVCISIVP